MTVAAPPRVAVELLHFAPQSDRAALLFAALQATAPAAHIDVHGTTTYHGDAPVLMLWGPGAPDRFAPMARQIAAGGRVVAFDLAYWSRDRKVRVSIDGPHPQRFVMARTRSATRFLADPAPILNHWKATGPVIVAGIGEKATAQYGDQVVTWEAQMTAESRARGLPVQYRAKRGQSVPIDRALQGASAVITWHSNVAVDAIRLGIPVICRDGAAAAVCPSTWPADGIPQPLPDAVRRQFLYNLAHFQYGLTSAEALGCWRFLTELLT